MRARVLFADAAHPVATVCLYAARILRGWGVISSRFVSGGGLGGVACAKGSQFLLFAGPDNSAPTPHPTHSTNHGRRPQLDRLHLRRVPAGAAGPGGPGECGVDRERGRGESENAASSGLSASSEQGGRGRQARRPRAPASPSASPGRASILPGCRRREATHHDTQAPAPPRPAAATAATHARSHVANFAALSLHTTLTHPHTDPAHPGHLRLPDGALIESEE